MTDSNWKTTCGMVRGNCAHGPGRSIRVLCFVFKMFQRRRDKFVTSFVTYFLYMCSDCQLNIGTQF